MVFERFREIVKNHHQYAQDWKEKTGKKVMGYFCTYVPEEIIYAADILPVRIMGSREPYSLSDNHIAWVYCSFCHDVLEQALKGRYDYLDGIVNAYGCNHIRQVFWSWREHLPISYSHQIYVPYYSRHRASKALILDELRKFKQSLEEWIGRTISTEDLDRAIETYNTNYRLLRQIYEMRKSDNPPLTGVEAMEMVLAGVYMDKEEHNQLLEQLLKELPERKIDTESKVRLMLVGTENDDIDLIEYIESSGGIVVIDDHCTGSRYFWNQVIPEEDRLLAITNRLVDKPVCPVRDLEAQYRQDHVLGLAKEYNVQGVIILQPKFCDPIEYDMMHLPPALLENGIRSLTLETDVINPSGQFRTRIEAFIEMFQQALI